MLGCTVSEDAARVQERIFLAALQRRPSDDDTRAVLADWLEEQGRAEDAELVRVFLARKAEHAGSADVLACSRRLEELASSSSWSGRRSVLYDPSLRATTQVVIDPPWTAFEPLRLGRVPSGHGTPDLFVCVESDGGPVLRIDLYDASSCDAKIHSGLVFVGHGNRMTCLEPYGRRRCSKVDLGSDFGAFYAAKSVLLVTSAARVFRLAPDGTMVWRSEPVGDGGVRILAVTEAEGDLEGEGEWDQWDDLATRRFRLDLATGAQLD